uniref:Agpsemzm n=1 Tax=Arundo donax TaxID=35708 RepID=A0A0A9CYX5_ARUDO
MLCVSICGYSRSTMLWSSLFWLEITCTVWITKSLFKPTEKHMLI